MLEVIFLIFLSGYFIQSVIFIIGSSKLFSKLPVDQLPSATVIVAARNEEENILRCLNSLNELVYPEEKLEILLVDDRSTDRTGEIIDEFIKDKPKFKKIVTQEEIGKLLGKTNALANAIKATSNEIILTTDADCIVSKNWVLSTCRYYKDDVGAIAGYTTQEAYSNFSGMQSLDFMYLLMVASGTINFNMPLSCIGNNMSYRRKAYEEVGGYENLKFSVTEDFALLYAISKLKKYKIISPANVDGLAISKPCPDFKTLMRQKKRWGVGGLDVPKWGFALLVFGFSVNLLVLLTPFLISYNWLTLVAFKLIVDYMMLYHVHRKFGLQSNMKYFPAFEIYYLLYVIWLPLSILLSRKVIWKGREYKA